MKIFISFCLILFLLYGQALLNAEQNDLTFEEQNRISHLFNNGVNEPFDILKELIQTEGVSNEHIIKAHQIRAKVPENYKFSLFQWVNFTKKFNPNESTIESITDLINFSFSLFYGSLKPKTKMFAFSPRFLSIKPIEVFSNIMEVGPNVINDANFLAHHYTPQELISKLTTDGYQISEFIVKKVSNSTELSPQQALDFATTYRFSSTTGKCKEAYNTCHFHYEQCYWTYIFHHEENCKHSCKKDEVSCLKNNGSFTLR